MAHYNIQSTKGIAGVTGNKPISILRDNSFGTADEVGEYKSPLFPKCTKEIRVIFDQRSNTWPVALSKDELNAIVADFGFEDEDGSRIITADKNHRSDPFFNHDDLIARIEEGNLSMDDETPIGLFWKKVAEADDMNYDINNDTDNPLQRARQSFKITTDDNENKKVVRDQDEGMRATELLHTMTDERMKEVARAMGIELPGKIESRQLKATLFEKITLRKDAKTNEGVRNIEAFLKTAEMSTKETELRSMITEAVEKRILQKRQFGHLYFAEIKVGNNIEQVYDFMGEQTNEALMSELIRFVKESRA